MKSKEISQANERGVTPKRVVIAMDGLSVITNARNPVGKLTMDEIGKICSGEITNWKDVGGSNMHITLYGRQSNSGTFVFFRDAVLKGDYSQRMNRMNGNAQIVESVKRDNSGSDVEWQAIKYTSSCSSFSQDEIYNYFAEYLGSDSDETQIKIEEFIDSEPDNLNEKQRIILVSKEFHSDVVSAVLWLREYGVDIECVRLTPYLADSICLP